ncbi:MAG: Asp-tRNA(Asn)/Glu-tRNA(Gln) amidotransferase subunit GatC [Candidatus Margulisbacteria bacterium]|nr:Asp-tRNA(Asn)/Glu-tRNA(Gln) amidotransferase subunit GatC [Candidatus Margulisiibacteriota bacterium]
MKIDVEHVAKLARLGLTEEEKTLFAQQLSAILDFADNLKKIKTDDVPPTAHAIALKNIYREDKVIPCRNVEDIMANAPDEENHMFRVPRIIE